MTWLLLLASTAYAVVNVFGAWAVVRRKPRLAGLFMLSAAALVVGGVSAAYGLYAAVPILAFGSVAAFLATLVYGRQVVGRYLPADHLSRAAAGAVLVALAHLVLRG